MSQSPSALQMVERRPRYQLFFCSILSLKKSRAEQQCIWKLSSSLSSFWPKKFNRMGQFLRLIITKQVRGDQADIDIMVIGTTSNLQNQLIEMKKTDSKQTVLINLIDELRSEEPKKRLNSVAHLKVIAQALGPDRARSELVPFLNEFLDDEDDILTALIIQLRGFGQSIGGDQYERVLLPLLIGVCRSESRTTSTAAMEIIKGILKRLDIRKNEDILMETIKKLIQSDYILSKEAGINILTSFILETSSPAVLMTTFVSFCENQDYRLRKIAVKNLKNLILHEPPNSGMNKILTNFIKDREDIIKILTLDSLLEYFYKDKSFVLDCFKELLRVNSWRINIRICQLMDALCGMLTKQQFKDNIQTNYIGFLNHSEPQLRAVACSCLGRVCLIMDAEDISQHIVPTIAKLSEDSSHLVKVEIAKRFLCASSFLKPQQFQKHMLPILSELLKNPDPQINLAVFSSLAFLEESIPNSQLEDITLTCVNQLFASANWRTKCQAVEIMKQLINYPIFVNDRTISMIVSWIFDKIDAVRKKTLDLLQLLFKDNSPHWVESKLIPRLLPIQNSSNYLQRQLILLIMERVFKYMPQQQINTHFVPVLQSLSKDKVPNIRYLVVKVIRGSQLGNVKCRVLIETLAEDKDLEVRTEARQVV